MPCKIEVNISMIDYNATRNVSCAVGVKNSSNAQAYIGTEKIIIYPSYLSREHYRKVFGSFVIMN